MITGIHHISMKCGTEEAYERARAFYLNVLGFSVVREWPDGMMIDSCSGLLEIFRNGNGIRTKGAIRHVAFSTDNVDDVIEKVKAAGYEVFIEPKDIVICSKPELHARIAFCYGPLGEEIEFFQEQRIIAACGNDCSACPRYVTHPYEKTEEELRHTAELWMKIGYRDHIVSNEEIACTGCKPENWCRYHVVKCCDKKGIKTCAECDEYPCANMQECFLVTKSFKPMCREVCTDQEYAIMKKAFFEKEQNLKEMREGL